MRNMQQNGIQKKTPKQKGQFCRTFQPAEKLHYFVEAAGGKKNLGCGRGENRALGME